MPSPRQAVPVDDEDDDEDLRAAVAEALATKRVVDIPQARGWSTPTFACHRNMSSCIPSCCCPCIQFGLNQRMAFGASAVIVQDRHSPPEGGVLAKSASGALEVIPVIRVVNLSRTLEQLAERGFLRLALADEAAQPIETTDLRRNVVLALGAEGQGLRRLTRENCDLAIRLPTSKAMPSLNVSNAAAVALYAWAAATKSK
jgi:tRNA(Leu) C34 or U34 (ribose-2'-O)-methylase TrmL